MTTQAVRRVNGALVLPSRRECVVVWGHGATRRMIGILVADPQCACRRTCRWHSVPTRNIGTYRAVRAEWDPEQHIPWAEIAAGRKPLVSPAVAMRSILGPGVRSVRDGVDRLVADARTGRKTPIHQALDVGEWRQAIERWEHKNGRA